MLEPRPLAQLFIYENKSISSGISENKTLTELWFNNKPNTDKNKVFGSHALFP